MTLNKCSMPLAVALALAGGVLPLAAQAQSPAASAAVATAPAAADWTEGEVRRVDPTNARVSLRHGEIKSLNMPPMTMAFAVRDPAWLNGLKAGDKVRFTVVDEGGGKLTVTALERVD